MKARRGQADDIAEAFVTFSIVSIDVYCDSMPGIVFLFQQANRLYVSLCLGW